MTIAVSEEVKKFLVKKSMVPQNKIVVVPNLLDNRFLSVKQYQKPANLPPLIGTVGSLNAQKGHILLIEALSLLKKKDKKLDWRCQIIGTGPLEKYLRRLIRKKKLRGQTSIITDAGDIREAMRHFTIYVQYSRTESFGMAVSEAMALGIPTIVSNKGALPEMVVDGRDGLVVPYGKAVLLAKAIERLIKNKSLRQNISVIARKKILKLYNQETILDEIEQVYSQAIKHK
jgi:glycosyltransferase involved in cell wall biosynthesis